MNAPKLQDMVDTLRMRIADPAKQAIVTEVAVDLADLNSRSFAGEQNLEPELAQVKAQLSSLTATELQVFADTFRAWAQDATRFVVSTALGVALG